VVRMWYENGTNVVQMVRKKEESVKNEVTTSLIKTKRARKEHMNSVGMVYLFKYFGYFGCISGIYWTFSFLLGCHRLASRKRMGYVLTKISLSSKISYFASTSLSQFLPITISLPSNSLIFSRHKEIPLTKFYGFGGCMRKTMIPENSSGRKMSDLRKSVSLLTKTAFLSFANLASLLFDKPLGGYSARKPFFSKNSLTSLGTFSSSRNLGWLDIPLASHKLGGIANSIENHFFSEARIAITNFIYCFAGCQKLKNVANHYSCSFERWLSMTDFCVNNNVLANFHSHIRNRKEEFKNSQNQGDNSL